MSKPLKTVDSIMNWQTHLLIREGITQNISETKELKITQEMLDEAKAEAITQLNNHYKELFLSIIDEDEPLTYTYKGIDGITRTVDIDDYQEYHAIDACNDLRAELRKKLSEHFNDNVLNSKEASTKGGEKTDE